MNKPDKLDPSLLELDAQLSQMNSPELEKAILAETDKAKIAKCLSSEAPISLTKKFAKRAGEVAELIDRQFTILEKARLADIQGDHDLAKKLCIQAGDEGDPNGWLQLGFMQVDDNKPWEAKMSFIHAGQMGLAEGYSELGNLQSSMGYYSDAVDSFTQAGKKGHWPSYMDAGLILKHWLGIPKEAKKMFDKAAELGGAEFYSQLADMEMHAEDIEGARKAYRKAGELGELIGYLRLGLLEEKDGKTDLAKKAYAKAIEHNNADSYLPMVVELEGLDGAKKIYENAAKLGVNRAYVLLGLLEFMKKNDNGAKTMFKKAMDLGVEDGYIHYGVALESEGELDTAETIYKKAIDKGFARANYYLDMLMKKQYQKSVDDKW